MRDPGILRRIAALEEGLRGFEHARKVTGLPDYVARIHRELGDGRGRAGIPDDPALVAQELFVFSLADSGRAELERIVTSDFSKSQITVKQTAMSSDLLFDQMARAERLAAGVFEGTPVRATVTGSGRLFATLDHNLVQSQMSSFATAFVAVFGIIFLVFRSWRFGLLAIVPNLFPVLAVFGVMGWLDISLNIATVMLASVALGVVDDDTVHFISRYRREIERARSSVEAIELATIHEGRAALTAAAINSCAFAVLALSAYKPTAWFGGLLALTMVVAFLAEILILPATIMLAPRLFGAQAARRRAVAQAG
jgi:predicted RND superfamily exporter protein